MRSFIFGALRRVLFVVIMLVFVFSLAVGWTMWRVRLSTPQLSGQIELAGLEGPAVIARDEYGVPHIFASTEADVFFALGYAHAQDRMFQMELIRRAVEGRLSEMVPSFIGGEALVRADARARIQGNHLAAQDIADHLGPDVRAAVDAYAAGVNALITARGYTPPPEFVLLGTKPEPWDAADTTAVWVYMTADLADGLGDEMENAQLANVLSPAQRAQFVGGYPPFGERSLAMADIAAATPGISPPQPLNEAPDAIELPSDAADTSVETEPGPGSNNWVVNGEHTNTGLPLLANDPHLGLGAPSVWYLVRLALPEGEVVGVTVPGAPLVVLGRNDRIAWGFTNTGYDVGDYVQPEGGADVTAERDEVIKVRYGDDVTVQVREAAEGVVLDPAYFTLGAFSGDVVLRTTTDDRANASPQATYDMMRARDWNDFVEAGRTYVAPMQNMIYADVDGNIGYMSPGRMPTRNEAGDWTGEVPFDALPRVLNPASGMIATANNEIVPDEYPYALDGEFSVYRVMRIHERLGETSLHDIDTFRSIQLDVTSSLARRLLPSIARGAPSTDEGAAIKQMLVDWDGEMSMSSAEALAYAVWFEAMHPALYADELGPSFDQFDYAHRVFLDRVLSGEWSQWCDDVSTESQRETCPEAIGAALDAAGATLISRYGPDPADWHWGEAHPAVFDHPLMTRMPLLNRWFDVRAPHGGDGSTVNVGHFNFGGEEYGAYHGASYRAIYDLSDLDASLYMHAPGQSGHPLSPHYRDLAPLWSAGDYIKVDTAWDLEAPPPGMRILELTPTE
ncbi:MAG: penicillin acylase family protein [Maricaulaceae bacterium]|jgi:penicillin amidase